MGKIRKGGDFKKGMQIKNKNKIAVILNDFRSVYNTASCFRTADGAGVKKIYLTGTTPEPKDRFGRERKDFAKVSLGAEKSVEYEKAEDILKLIDDLKKEGFLAAAVEQDKKSEDLFLFAKKCKEMNPRLHRNDKEMDSRMRPPYGETGPPRQALGETGGNDRDKIALIFGNEVEGISKEILEKCDKILEIPMSGKKESLNVAVAFGVAVYTLSDL